MKLINLEKLEKKIPGIKQSIEEGSQKLDSHVNKQMVDYFEARIEELKFKEPEISLIFDELISLIKEKEFFKTNHKSPEKFEAYFNLVQAKIEDISKLIAEKDPKEFIEAKKYLDLLKRSN